MKDMNVWFGPSWGALICDSTPHVATPVGEPCIHCAEHIEPGDRGIGAPHVDERGVRQVFYHLECWFRLIFGSVGHQMKVCSCYGGEFEDAPGLSQREAAQAAYDLAMATAAVVPRRRATD